MCRLLASISLEPTSLAYWFFDAPKPFTNSACEHKDGWGISWYEEKETTPFFFKQGAADVDFHPTENSCAYAWEEVEKIKSTHQIAHLRKASRSITGPKTYINAHPFTHQNWSFAHNGSMDRANLISHIEPAYQQFIQGTTDSEVFFTYLMQQYQKTGDMTQTIRDSIKKCKPHTHKAFNFVLSDGHNMYVHRNASVEHDAYTLHMLKEKRTIAISSEPLDGKPWRPLQLGELLTIDKHLIITYDNTH